MSNQFLKPFSAFFTKFLTASVLVGGLFLHPAQAAPRVQTETLDRIIAVVNSGVITEKELDSKVSLIKMQMQKQNTTPPEDSVLRKQVLERLINDQLQLQYAAQTGLRVDNEQLDKAIQRIADQNKLSLDQFIAALNQEGISYPRFREDIRNEITLARLREREIENKVNVTDSEINNYLTTEANKPKQEEYNLSHILVNVPENSAPDQVKKLKAKADQIYAQLQTGKSFAQVSAAMSDAPNALEGGQLGWRSTSQIPTAFLDAIQPLAPGQYTPVLRSPNGFHILKVVEKRGNTNDKMVIDQTHARHILIKVNEAVSSEQALHKIEGIHDRLKNGEDFAKLARQYSDDNSAKSGGDLGWLNPGDTVPQFDQAMNALQPNQISAPVQTQFGWHIIQVLERRNKDVTNDAARMKARQDIRARKADEMYQDWVRELRDQAYVEMRLEDKY